MALNLVIQALALCCALLVNFFIPFHYGLEYYGAFIKANVLVFLVQKLADISTEPLIGHVSPSMVFPCSILLSGFVWFIFAAADWAFGLGSIALLAAMLLSSCVMLSMHALGQRKRLVAYLLLFLSTFTLLMVVEGALGWNLSIVDILLWTNLLPALLAGSALIRSSAGLPSRSELVPLLATLAKMTPVNFSATLVLNLFTNFLPWLLSKTLPLGDLGLFRVVVAIVQSATAIFPISTKTIFARLVACDDPGRLFRALLAWSLIYFSCLGLLAVIAGEIEPRILPYLALVAGLPTLYWAILVERQLQATRQSQVLVRVNLIVGSLAMVGAIGVGTIGQAVLYYSIGLSVYTICLFYVNRYSVKLFTVLLVVCSVPIVVMMQSFHAGYAVVYFSGILIICLREFKPNFLDLSGKGGLA